MTVKNSIAEAIKTKGLSRYRFWQLTGLARVTAYRLVDDPLYVPGGEVLDKVCFVLNCQPGDILTWYRDPDPAI